MATLITSVLCEEATTQEKLRRKKVLELIFTMDKDLNNIDPVPLTYEECSDLEDILSFF